MEHHGQRIDVVLRQVGVEREAVADLGKVADAKALYPKARGHWEEIEPVAEPFGDLDPKIDGREDIIAEGVAFTGYHRLEKDLWVDGEPHLTRLRAAVQPRRSSSHFRALRKSSSVVPARGAVERRSARW